MLSRLFSETGRLREAWAGKRRSFEQNAHLVGLRQAVLGRLDIPTLRRAGLGAERCRPSLKTQGLQEGALAHRPPGVGAGFGGGRQ